MIGKKHAHIEMRKGVREREKKGKSERERER
jgi:hypothetical protein